MRTSANVQGCLAPKRWSASSLNCKYPNHYIKLKLMELAIKWYHKFWHKLNCRIFHDTKCKRLDHLLKATSQMEFSFSPIYFFLGFRTKTANKFCVLPYLIAVKSYSTFSKVAKVASVDYIRVMGLSIKTAPFTSGHNVKPPFLPQYFFKFF